jgi:hypothetical protein
MRGIRAENGCPHLDLPKISLPMLEISAAMFSAGNPMASGQNDCAGGRRRLFRDRRA